MAPNEGLRDEAVPRLSGDVIDRLIVRAERRAALVGELKEALVRGDTLAALELARRVCGLAPVEARN
jgi:hypothetical protein